MHYTLDLSNVTEYDELFDALSEQLPLSSHMDNSMDALYDALSNVADGWVLTILNYQELQESDPKCFKKFRRTLLDVSVDLPDFEVRFSSGDGASDDSDSDEEIDYSENRDAYTAPDDNYSDTDEYDHMSDGYDLGQDHYDD